MTLGDWLDTWLELYVDASDLAQSTKLCYHRSVAAVPFHLAKQPLCDVSSLDLRRWLLSVASQTPRAAQLDRVMLSRSLRIAAKLGFCRPGLLDPEVVPQIKHKANKAQTLDFDQMAAYMAAAAASPCAVPLLLCCCGLRRCEALGARWEQLDVASGVLRVVGQRRGDQLAPLKSRASVRSIALPPIVLAAINRVPRQLGGWLCDCSCTTLYAEHRRVLRAAQLPAVTLHGLRHTFATLAVMDGQPIKLVQAALGHAHYSLTADLYADHLPPISGVSSSLYA